MTRTVMHDGTTVAGRVPLGDVMAQLARRRPIFHSEADLQHAFAQSLWELAPDVRSRLEVPQRAEDKAEYLDLLCIGPSVSTAIEFKYFTRRWAGAAGTPAEEYELKDHAAADLARLHFVRDIVRLERFCRRSDQNGFAILLTNAASLWSVPGRGREQSRDRDFRIHEGRELVGKLLWAEGTYEGNTCTLHGRYPLRWEPYSQQAGAGGEFRYLVVPVSPERETAEGSPSPT
ncbi:hypothetical protein ACFWA4_25960 [Streptomyces sp. NPDC060011]|uniref:hypothetical protein n=1 Tax=unclassified Streptomyces TaxID=2593676 RepID=UPI002DD7C8AA|nr:hypothetical protein [Streptomyces sp. NBC_01558]WSD77887.1 hypothetical protein OHB33_16945 [Streptomyces sp. NBC_01558]